MLLSCDSPEETLPLVEMADTDSAVMEVTRTDISIISHVRTKVEEIKKMNRTQCLYRAPVQRIDKTHQR